ncbi:HNH endonuclease [Cardiobacteriaceae bacterium TAE3-ERU3]|nr:HNH endonuclease [Cardiobacteriaceae bacterium TAE3-ERU3]
MNDLDRYADAIEKERQAQEDFDRLALEAIRSAKAIQHWGDGHGGHLMVRFGNILAAEMGLSYTPPEPEKRYKKRAIGQSKRMKVFERDEFACKHCGIRKDLTIDHIIPESKGGSNDIDNLQTLCRSCNSIKGTKMPEGVGE